MLIPLIIEIYSIINQINAYYQGGYISTLLIILLLLYNYIILLFCDYSIYYMCRKGKHWVGFL